MRHLIIMTLACLAPVVGAAESWPWYGGPNHNGQVTGASAVPDGKGMEVLWKVPMLSPGHSGAAVADGQAFILDRRGNHDDGEDVLRVLDLASGKELWQFAHPAPGDARPQSIGFMPHRSGPVTVPALNDTHVFVAGNQARLYCIDRQTHKLAWSQQLPATVTHGSYSPSPLLIDDLVIVSYTSKGSDFLEAFQVRDGSSAWKTEAPYKTKKAISVVHATPISADVFGERQVIATHRRVTFGADPRTGEILWQYEGYVRGTIQSEVAISPDGFLFFCSGHDGASALVKISKGTEGYTFTDIYNDGPKQRGSTRACSEWRPGHWLGDHLYHVSNHFASHGLLCMDKQGTVLWKTRTKDKSKRGPSFRYSCLTIVDGIGLAMHGGQLKVIRLNPERYEELGSLDVFNLKEIDPGERPDGLKDRSWKSYPRRLAFSTWAKHAYADGLFLTRNGQWLACVRVAPDPAE